MEFNFENTCKILQRTPATLEALLSDLPGEWVHANEGSETWSPYNIIGHLSHCERADWLPRLKIILNYGTSRAFDPFDRFAQLHEPQDRPLQDLLAEFSGLRRENLDQLAALNLTDTHFALEGIHPEFGNVTAAQLLTTWGVHDLNHMAQLSRVLAHQQDAAVGPWKQYLGVLNWR